MTGRGRASVTLLALAAMREMRAKGSSLMAIGDAVRAKGFDRVARSMKQLIETIETLRVRVIGFRSLTEALDTTTAQGRLVFHMFGARAV